MGSLSTLLPAFLTGQSVIAADYKRFRPAEQLALLERYGVTHADFPPTALNMLRQEDLSAYDLELSMILSGGEALSPETFRHFESHGIPVLEGYGQTEATPLISNCEAFFEVKAGSIGKPVPGHEIVLLTDLVDEPGVGEIALRTPDPAKFKRYINDSVEEDREDGLYLTGDLATRDEDGYYWYKTRVDNIIISSGYRISPVEVENAIKEHEAVDEVVVSGVDDEIRGSIVKAYITVQSPGDRTPETKDEIQTLVKEQLAKYEYPRKIEFVESIPRTVTGKKDRTAFE
jgi:acetyl-CoA synthetase